MRRLVGLYFALGLFTILPSVGASPGTYRITVRYGSAVVADGNFTVR